jgi:agmatinase
MADIKSESNKIRPGTVVVIGVPLDENSSYLTGASLAPTVIRDSLNSGSANMSTELGVDLEATDAWKDLGDLKLGTGESALKSIEEAVGELLNTGCRVLTLGGDHSISYPVIRAFAGRYPNLTVLHIDAHPDTYDEFGGSKFSHACPFARVMEEGKIRRLVQVGIRTLNPHQRKQAERFHIETIEMKDWSQDSLPRLEGPIYLSLDLDALDPAFAPGVSHHEPGGLTARDVLRIIHGLPTPIVGADIVELNPKRDTVGTTAMLAAKFYRELVGRMLS